MRENLQELNRWLAAGERIVLGTVVRASGSSPRPPGSCLGITGSGEMAGSVSNGCVEGAVFQEAQDVLAGRPPKRLHYGPSSEDSWQIGLACGGSIEVYIEPLVEAHRQVLMALEAEETIALATYLDGSGHVLAWPDGRTEGDFSLARELAKLFPGPAAELRNRHHTCASDAGEGDVFLQVFTPQPILIIVGASHIAVALVGLAQALGFRVRVVDARRAFATRNRFPTVDELVVAWPQDELKTEELGPQHSLVVLSHDPKFDLPALRAALRSQIAYIGLLGSRATQERRRSALQEEGFAETDLRRIHGPVGLDLGGREAAEMALSILAEVVAVRHGKHGGNLGKETAREQS